MLERLELGGKSLRSRREVWKKMGSFISQFKPHKAIKKNKKSTKRKILFIKQTEWDRESQKHKFKLKHTGPLNKSLESNNQTYVLPRAALPNHRRQPKSATSSPTNWSIPIYSETGVLQVKLPKQL